MVSHLEDVIVDTLRCVVPFLIDLFIYRGIGEGDSFRNSGDAHTRFLLFCDSGKPGKQDGKQIVLIRFQCVHILKLVFLTH